MRNSLTLESGTQVVRHTLHVFHQTHRIPEHTLIDTLMDKTPMASSLNVGHQIGIVDVTAGQRRDIAHAARKPETTADSVQRRTCARVRRWRSPGHLHRA
jgi:hypothetical protein